MVSLAPCPHQHHDPPTGSLGLQWKKPRWWQRDVVTPCLLTVPDKQETGWISQRGWKAITLVTLLGIHRTAQDLWGGQEGLLAKLCKLEAKGWAPTVRLLNNGIKHAGGAYHKKTQSTPSPLLRCSFFTL